MSANQVYDTTMDSGQKNTNYSLNQNYVTDITVLTKNYGITVGKIERQKVALEKRRGLEPKLLSQKICTNVKLIYLKIEVKT